MRVVSFCYIILQPDSGAITVTSESHICYLLFGSFVLIVKGVNE
jgi:hypothetical protein